MPTKLSLQAYAESLSNFLEWAELRGVDWKNASYAQHLLDGYQKEMTQGSWSTKGKGLAPSTINCWRRPKTEPLMRVVPTQN